MTSNPHGLRRLLGVGDTTIPTVTGPARTVRVGVGDMLAWAAHSGLIVAVVRVDHTRDVCVIDDGRHLAPVVFDGHHLQPMVISTVGVADHVIAGSGNLAGTPITVLTNPDTAAVTARVGDITWIAEPAGPRHPAHWVNALGHISQPALEAPHPPLGGPR